MNLTISPYKNKQYYHNNQTKLSFGSKTSMASDLAEAALEQTANQGSSFFKPLNDAYDKFTDGVAKHFTSRVVESGFLNSLADKFKNSRLLYQHCLTVGSVVTSGLYMQRTYTNKKLDEDRRNTLVVNQGLTLLLSTAGAYTMDKYMTNWWENVTARFAGHLLSDKELHNDFLNKKNEIKASKGKMPKLDEFMKERASFKALAKDETAKTIFESKIHGMGLLKSMIVFGFVYRFFVPVVVTKPANKLCDIYLQKKHEKEAMLAKNA